MSGIKKPPARKDKVNRVSFNARVNKFTLMAIKITALELKISQGKYIDLLVEKDTQ